MRALVPEIRAQLLSFAKFNRVSSIFYLILPELQTPRYVDPKKKDC